MSPKETSPSVIFNEDDHGPTADLLNQAFDEIHVRMNESKLDRVERISVEFKRANTDVTVRHTLGKVPTHWAIIDHTLATGGGRGSIIRTAWNGGTITLQCTQALNNATIELK